MVRINYVHFIIFLGGKYFQLAQLDDEGQHSSITYDVDKIHINTKSALHFEMWPKII